MVVDSHDYSSLLKALKGDSIGLALLELSAVLTRRSEAIAVGNDLLDELATSVSEKTPRAVADSLFGHGGLRGDVLNYHAEENSLLDRVLERRLGMPITLSAVAIEVGRRIGLPWTMVAMPGHVVVGTGEPNCFLDAFGGVELDEGGLWTRFESIFGTDAPPGSFVLQELDPSGAVNRVCNNLLRTWKTDRTGKIDQLLELRVAIPGSDADRHLVQQVAEARGRFDLVAAIREETDPDDPDIQQLWARLN